MGVYGPQYGSWALIGCLLVGPYAINMLLGHVTALLSNKRELLTWEQPLFLPLILSQRGIKKSVKYYYGLFYVFSNDEAICVVLMPLLFCRGPMREL